MIKVNLPRRYTGIVLATDVQCAAVVVSFEADEVPSCTMRVVRSLHAAYDDIVRARAGGMIIDQVLLSSRMEGIFNMGGDLALMSAAARSGDRETLKEYGRLAAGLVHRTWDGLGVGLTTISAIDGDAFGGGCEAALSANVVVASTQSRFAFPETRFGLFPGMGATSLVGRRVSPAFASAMIADGRIIDAGAAAEKGLVDRVVGAGAERRVLRFLRSRPDARRHIAEVARLRRLQAAYSYEEAQAIVSQWVDAVLQAPERTLVQIERIVRAQKARVGRAEVRSMEGTKP